METLFVHSITRGTVPTPIFLSAAVISLLGLRPTAEMIPPVVYSCWVSSSLCNESCKPSKSGSFSFVGGESGSRAYGARRTGHRERTRSSGLVFLLFHAGHVPTATFLGQFIFQS